MHSVASTTRPSIPELFGDGLGANGLPAFGKVLVSGRDWLGGRGVNVYSNGHIGCHRRCRLRSAYGIKWQCVELFQRFFRSKGWSGPVPGNATNLYANAPAADFAKHPNGRGYVPVPGDAIVFKGGWGNYGHVAIVEWVSNNRIGIVEQNASANGRAVLTLSGSRIGAYGSLTPRGTLHARANRLTDRRNGDEPPTGTEEPNSGTGTTQWLAADLNADGRDDLVHVGTSRISTMLADGAGGYKMWAEGIPAGRPGHPTNVDRTKWLAADLNADGRDDLVHVGTSALSTMLATGNGTYAMWREGTPPGRPGHPTN